MASGTYIRSIIVVNILTLNLGIHLGWTPWLIENLENANSSLNVTIDQITWIASIPQIGDLIGGFIVFFVGNHVGRRSMLFCSLILLLFSWMMLLLYDTVLAIYTIRTVMGISAGMCFPLISIYFSEIALVNHRGMVTSSQAFSMKLGVLLMYLYSAFVPSKNTFIFPTTLVVLSGLLLPTVPETPYYLVLHKNYEEAKKSLTRLRHTFEEKEIQMIVKDTENCVAKCKWKDFFLVSNNRKVLLVVTSIVVTSQFAGNAIILAYINDIFIAFGKKSSMKLLTSCTGTIGRVSTVCTMLLVDRMGRKTIFLVSVSGGGISSFIIGTCSLLLEKNYHVDVVSSIAVIGIFLFVLMTSLGQPSVMYVLTSELFAPNVRTFGAAYQSRLSTICLFIVSKMFGIVMKEIGMYAMFFVFVGFTIINILIIAFLLPETKRRTFREIQDILGNKNASASVYVIQFRNNTSLSTE